MKKSKITLIIVIILTVVALILILRGSKGTIRGKIKNFAIEDTLSVTKIFLTDKSNRSITLKKITPGNWQLNNKYKSQTENVNNLLNTIFNIEVKRPVSKTEHNNVIKRMSAIAIKVEIYQNVYRINLFDKIKLFPHEKLTKTYYVGDATKDHIGTYMLMKNSSIAFVTYMPGFRGFLSTRYDTDEKNWRSHTIFKYKIDNIKSVSLKFPENPELSYTLTKTNNNKYILTSLSDNKVIDDYDTLKVWDFLYSFRKICFEVLLNDFDKHKKDSILSSTPFHILTITDVSGKSKTIKTFHKRAGKGYVDFKGNTVIYDRDRLYAYTDNKDFALIQSFVFDKILRPVTYFQKNKK
jgi:hypothetical protein